MLLLLSGGISLNLGPTPIIVSQCFWEPFKNKGLRFLHLNIDNTILPKLDELKTITGNIKAAVIGVAESKVGNSIYDSEVTACFDVLRTEIGKELHVMLGRIRVLI